VSATNASDSSPVSLFSEPQIVREAGMKESTAPPVQIKAIRDGFLLVPSPTAPFQTVMEFMSQRLTESYHFLKRARMTLDFSRRPFRAEEVRELRRLLREKADVELIQVRLGEDLRGLLSWASEQLEVPLSTDQARQPEAQPVVVRTTCRSGSRIESEADCFILGDVNPGAEVLAAGDVIVFGNLRGIAHAGTRGDRSARIWALSIEPSQIRIADLVAVPPKGPRRGSGRFEVAEIEGDVIQVTTL
jgi:septum site-determining protein MinC